MCGHTFRVETWFQLLELKVHQQSERLYSACCSRSEQPDPGSACGCPLRPMLSMTERSERRGQNLEAPTLLRQRHRVVTPERRDSRSGTVDDVTHFSAAFLFSSR